MVAVQILVQFADMDAPRGREGSWHLISMDGWLALAGNLQALSLLYIPAHVDTEVGFQIILLQWARDITCLDLAYLNIEFLNLAFYTVCRVATLSGG